MRKEIESFNKEFNELSNQIEIFKLEKKEKVMKFLFGEKARQRVKSTMR